jgi:hypothetical protein
VRAALPPGLASPGGVLAAERDGEGTVRALCIDVSGRVLTEIAWRPGALLEVSAVTLSEGVMELPAAASLAGGRLLLTDHEAGLVFVDRRTGVVEKRRHEPAPAVLSPDGRHLVGATDEGLLSWSVRLMEAAPTWLYWPRPLLVTPLDNPHAMLLVPGSRPDRFTLTVGCYGRVGLIDIERLPPGPQGDSRLADLSGLVPYDPIHLHRPAPLHNGHFTHIFASDESFAGLCAIALGTGDVLRCPLDGRDYGTVRAAVPSLSGDACLVQTRDGTWQRWVPELELEPAGVEGMPLMWDGAGMVVSGEGDVWEVTAAKLA